MPVNCVFIKWKVRLFQPTATNNANIESNQVKHNEKEIVCALDARSNWGLINEMCETCFVFCFVSLVLMRRCKWNFIFITSSNVLPWIIQIIS